MSQTSLERRNILSLDIGGSKALSALVDVEIDATGVRRATARHIARRTLSKDSGQEGVWQALLSAVDETLTSAKLGRDDFNVIGATIPGVADPSTGLWIYAPYSGISDFPLGRRLFEEFGVPVYADNDVNACAWGEKVFGVCQKNDNFLWITVSNGIGGGLVLNGRPYAGKFSGAAEIGHFNVVDNGALCGCGNRGCLEATAAGPAIARSYRETVAAAANGSATVSLELTQAWINYLGKVYGKTNLDDLNLELEVESAQSANAATIASEARRGNPLALEIFRMVGFHLGRASSWAANLVNPEKIVIGGGVAGAYDLFYPTLESTLQERLFHPVNKSLVVEKTGLGYEAGLLGAAALAFANPYV